jgi:hypothetical protein
MRKLRVAVAFAAASMSLLAPAVAHAQPYPAQVPRLMVDQAAVFRGQSVNVSASNFAPFEYVVVVVAYSPSASTSGSAAPGETAKPDTRQRNDIKVRTSSLGTFSLNLRMTGRGVATIVAFGQTSGISAAVQVRILEGSGGSDNAAGTAGASGAGGPVGALPGNGPSGGTAALLVGSALTALAGWAWRTRRPFGDWRVAASLIS